MRSRLSTTVCWSRLDLRGSLTAVGTSSHDPVRLPAPARPSQPPRRCTTCAALRRAEARGAGDASSGCHHARLEMRGFEALVLARDVRSNSLSSCSSLVSAISSFLQVLPSALCLSASVSPLEQRPASLYQHLPRAAQSRPHGADRAPTIGGRLFIRKPVQLAEHDDLPVVHRQPQNRPPQLARGLRARDRLGRVARNRECAPRPRPAIASMFTSILRPAPFVSLQHQVPRDAIQIGRRATPPPDRIDRRPSSARRTRPGSHPRRPRWSRASAG